MASAIVTAAARLEALASIPAADSDSDSDAGARRAKEVTAAATAELLRAMRSKDAKAAMRCEHSLELERRKRRTERVEASLERTTLQEGADRSEITMLRQVAVQQDAFERLSEDSRQRRAELAAQLELAQRTEVALRERNDDLSADVRRLCEQGETAAANQLAAQAQNDALSGELADATALLRRSEEVRAQLVVDAKHREDALDLVRRELSELRLVETASRDSGRAQYDKLSRQCESLARQAQERLKACDVITERNRRLEESLRLASFNAEQASGEAEAARRAAEATVVRLTADKEAVQAEADAHGLVATKLRKTIAGLEVQLEEQKSELQSLRRELLQQHGVLHDHDITIRTGQQREAQHVDMVTSLEERLAKLQRESETHQTNHQEARALAQALDFELRGVRGSHLAAQGEVERLRKAEYDARQGHIRQSEEKHALHNSECTELHSSLAGHRQEIREHCEAADRMVIKHAQERTNLLASLHEGQEELNCNKDALERLRSSLADAFEEHRTLSVNMASVRRELALAELQASTAEASHKAAEERTAEVREEATARAAELVAAEAALRRLQRPVLVAEKEVLTSPRLLSSLIHAGSLMEPTVALVLPDMSTLWEYLERRIRDQQNCFLLLDAWQTWLVSLHAVQARSRVEMALGDDTEYRAARAQGLSDGEARLLTLRLETENVSSATATIKRLLLEFRRRAAAAVAELLPSPQVIEEELGGGRQCLGRMLHAACFLYQKLRTLVPTELNETMQQPLSRLVPVPFYLVPYKARSALRQGANNGAVLPSSAGNFVNAAPMAPRGNASAGNATDSYDCWLSARVVELEDMLPVNTETPHDVPRFLVSLLHIRARADNCAGGLHHRDRLDVLLLDALTVYSSGWRGRSPSPSGAALSWERKNGNVPDAVDCSQRPVCRGKAGQSRCSSSSRSRASTVRQASALYRPRSISPGASTDGAPRRSGQFASRPLQQRGHRELRLGHRP